LLGDQFWALEFLHIQVYTHFIDLNHIEKGSRYDLGRDLRDCGQGVLSELVHLDLWSIGAWRRHVTLYHYIFRIY